MDLQRWSHYERAAPNPHQRCHRLGASHHGKGGSGRPPQRQMVCRTIHPLPSCGVTSSQPQWTSPDGSPDAPARARCCRGASRGREAWEGQVGAEHDLVVERPDPGRMSPLARRREGASVSTPLGDRGAWRGHTSATSDSAPPPRQERSAGDSSVGHGMGIIRGLWPSLRPVWWSGAGPAAPEPASASAHFGTTRGQMLAGDADSR